MGLLSETEFREAPRRDSHSPRVSCRDCIGTSRHPRLFRPARRTPDLQKTPGWRAANFLLAMGEEASTAARPEMVEGMAHQEPGPVEEPGQEAEDTALLRHLSLSTQTNHADDFLNSHQAVAPPMHVSTTFRYSNDPGQLSPWKNPNVRFSFPLCPLPQSVSGKREREGVFVYMGVGEGLLGANAQLPACQPARLTRVFA